MFLLVFLVFLLIPGVSLPIKVFVQRLFLTGPDIELSEGDAIFNETMRLIDLEGNTVYLSPSTDRFKLINFWATWCPPCVAEMPSLASLYEAYGNEVDFYLITQEDEAVVKEFLEKKGLRLPVYRPAVPVPKALRYRSIPTTFLIGGKGKVLLREEGASNWNSEGFRLLLDSLLRSPR